MDLPYSVVSFLYEGDFSDEDNDVTSEVPTVWLTPDKNECWWPKTTDVNTYIAKRKPPVTNSRKWSLYRVKVEGYYDNLEKARSAAADKKSESEMSSSDRLDKPYLRKRKQPLPQVREEDSADRENSGDSDDNHPKIIEDPPKFNISSKKNESTSTASSSIDDEVPNSVKSSSHRQKKDINPLPRSQINSDRPQEMVSNLALLPRDQKKRSHVSIVNIQSLPIQFEDNFTLSSSLIRVPQKDASLPSHSRTGQSLFDASAIGDSNFNQDITTAVSGRSLSNSRPTANDTRQLSLGQSIDESLLFDGNLSDLCDGSNTRKVINENFSNLAGILGEISITMKSVDQRLNAIEDKINVNGTVRPRQDFKRVTGDLPFKNNIDIQLFEAKLAADDFNRIFVQYVGQVGGNNAKENILRILRHVFANSVAKNASWRGLRNNLQLSELKVIRAIKEGVRVKNPCTDKEFEKIVSEWFRQGNQRFKRETLKQNPPQHQATHDGNE